MDKVKMSCGKSRWDAEILFHVPQGVKHVKLTIEQNRRLQARGMGKRPQARRMVYAFTHMARVNRAEASKLHALRPSCMWISSEAEVGEFVRQCLHFAESRAGEFRPRLLGDLVHGEGVGEIIYFDFLHIRAGGSSGKDGGGKVPNKYIFVIFEDASSYVWLKRAATCDSAVTAAASLVCGHGRTASLRD